MQRFNVYYFSVFCLILIGSLFSISARRQSATYTVYDEDGVFNESLVGTAPKSVAEMQFDRVVNEAFFPRDGLVFRRDAPVWVYVSGVCEVKRAVHWRGDIDAGGWGSVPLFNVNDTVAVFHRAVYGNVLDLTIRQYEDSNNAVGCHVTLQEIK